MSTTIQPHQRRVIEELRELREKAAKLCAFTLSLRFAQLPFLERAAMRQQLAGMSTYVEALERRLDLWEIRVHPLPEYEPTNEQRSAAAIRTLEAKGYTWSGAEFWKPPLGKAPEWSSCWAQAADMTENCAQVSEALQAFAEDQTGDNAAGIVAAVLEFKASQPVEAPSVEDIERCWRDSSGTRYGFVRFAREVAAACAVRWGISMVKPKESEQ